MSDHAQRIAELNDRFRSQLMMPLFFEPYIVPGKVMSTAGINAITPVDRLEVFFKVRNFTDFTPDNNPHGERDFGSFVHNDQKIFWKIDYYAPDLERGSEDPADLTQTMRVLTIMLANEY